MCNKITIEDHTLNVLLHYYYHDYYYYYYYYTPVGL